MSVQKFAKILNEVFKRKELDMRCQNYTGIFF